MARSKSDKNVQENRLRVGRLTKPHGLKGALKLELFTDNPELRFQPGATFTLQVPEDSPWFGRTITIRELKWFNHQPVGFFDEIPDRTAAESIARAILWIDQEDAEANPEPDAWYGHQLAGLEVRRDGEVIGAIKEVQHLPGQDLLVVKTSKDEVLVPFVSAIVPEVNVEAGFVVVDPPRGLFEDSDNGDGSDTDED